MSQVPYQGCIEGLIHLLSVLTQGFSGAIMEYEQIIWYVLHRLLYIQH